MPKWNLVDIIYGKILENENACTLCILIGRHSRNEASFLLPDRYLFYLFENIAVQKTLSYTPNVAGLV